MGKHQISALLAPVEQILGKSSTGPLWKKSIRRPWSKVLSYTCTMTQKYI